MNAPSIDAGRLGIMLNELHLPSMKAIWADFAARADKEGEVSSGPRPAQRVWEADGG